MQSLQSQKKRVAIYLRVSTDEQTKGYGLDVQQEKLVAFVQSQEGYVIDQIHVYREEGFSGTLPISARPELKRLFDNAKNKEFDIVLVYRIDRFFRKTRLLLEAIDLLGEYGIGFRSTTESFDTTNPTGKFTSTLLAAVAEMERDTIRERTMGGRTKAARSGKWVTGVPPYGYKLDKKTKKLSVIPEEASIVRKMYEMVVYEKLKLRDIERKMNKLGINSPKFGTFKKRRTYNYWYARTIGRILTNEIYTGKAYFRKYLRPFKNLTSLIEEDLKRPEEDWIQILVPPIISRELFEKAMEQLVRNREDSKRNMKQTYMYAKLLYCGYCGFKMFSGFQPARKGRGGVGTKYYHGIHRKDDAVGTTKRCLKCPQYAESRLEPIWGCLKEILGDPKNIMGALEKYAFKSEDKESVKRKITLAQKHLGVIEIKRKKLTQVYVDTELDEKSYKEQLAQLKRDEDQAKEEIAKFSQHLLSKEDKRDRQKILQDLFSKIETRMKNLDYEDRRYIISLFVNKIILYARSNYAEVVFKFPNALLSSKKVEIGNPMESLFLNIKTLTEREVLSEAIKRNPLMYHTKITV